MTNTKKEIYITTQFTGFHHWPDAPEPVIFLRSLHRHVFHVKVGVIVSHNDRAVEFFKLKNITDYILFTGPSGTLHDVLLKQPAMSCEMMAEWIAAKLGSLGFNSDYNVSYVEVSEDGENGARLEFVKE